MDERPAPPPEDQADAPPRGLPLWVPLVAAVLAVAFALAVAALTCGPLLVIVNPPMPPIYPDATLLEVEHIDHGIDTWRYRADADVCDVLALYEAEALRCSPLPPGFCAAPRTPPSEAATRFVTQCRGRGEAWPFYWLWEMVLREGYGEDGAYSEFDISRTVYWSTGDS